MAKTTHHLVTAFFFLCILSLPWSRLQAAPEIQPVSWTLNPGEITIKLNEKKLYYVFERGKAYVYPVAIPRSEKNIYRGRTQILRKRPKPTWVPTPNMRQKNSNLPKSISGGSPKNPLGSYALNLGFPLIRIHGNNNPGSIGRAASAGCYRMYNKDVLHLAELVRIGTNVTVIN